MRPAPHKLGKFEGRREWVLHVFPDALGPSTCSVDAAECEQARRQGWVCATCKYLLQAICKLMCRRVHKHICLPTNTLRRVAQMDRIRMRIRRAGERKKKSGRKGGYMSDSSDCVLGAQKLMGAFVGVRFSRDQGRVVLKCPESCARTKADLGAWMEGRCPSELGLRWGNRIGPNACGVESRFVQVGQAVLSTEQGREMGQGRNAKFEAKVKIGDRDALRLRSRTVQRNPSQPQKRKLLWGVGIWDLGLSRAGLNSLVALFLGGAWPGRGRMRRR